MSDLEQARREELSLLEQVESSLRELGVDVAWIPGPSDHPNLALDGHFRVRWGGGEHLFPVEVKHNVRPATLELAGRPPTDAILVTEHVSPRLADRLEQIGWQGYADASGNAHLQAPGLLIRATGRAQRVAPPSPTLPFTRTGLPVTFAVLVAHARGLDWTQRDLARWAGASLGTVNRVIQALRGAGHIDHQGYLQRSTPLEDQWTAAYLTIQPQVWPHDRYTSSRWAGPSDVLSADLPDGVLIGSELAAQRHGASIRPTTALIHCPPECRNELIKAGRLRRDADGFITVRPAFWSPELFHDATTAPPFLVRADLLLEDDPRLTEIARDRKMTWNAWT